MTKTVIEDFSESEMREVYYAVAQRYLDIKVGRYDREPLAWRVCTIEVLKRLIAKIEKMGVEL